MFPPHLQSDQIVEISKDPFDQLLAAQALLEGVALVSKDPAFDAFPVNRAW